jgi:hypothetical protein
MLAVGMKLRRSDEAPAVAMKLRRAMELRHPERSEGPAPLGPDPRRRPGPACKVPRFARDDVLVAEGGATGAIRLEEATTGVAHLGAAHATRQSEPAAHLKE